MNHKPLFALACVLCTVMAVLCGALLVLFLTYYSRADSQADALKNAEANARKAWQQVYDMQDRCPTETGG